MVLGLASPAFAAAPVISGFTPDSGSEAGGCVVVVTGTALDDFATATWTFEPGAIPAADYVLISDTEAWVTAPAALASGVAYNIKVVNAGGTSTSTGTFLATAGAGNCAPTITKITPDCGSTNDKIVIEGTNLLLNPDGAAELAPGDNDIAGGTVEFSPYGTPAAVVPPDSDTSTMLTRFVSSNAADGPIKVIAGGGTVFSTESFDVPPPDCQPDTGAEHARTVTLKLRKHLVAKGKVTADPELAECIAGVTVKIQRKKGGAWKSVGTATTNDAGAYKKRIKDKPGKYRARIGKLSIGDPVTDTCLGDKSPVVRHSH
jgi:IPT/TIG domain